LKKLKYQLGAKMDLERTVFGRNYLNTYMEMGFPRVIANNHVNRKQLILCEVLKFHNEGKYVYEIAKLVGFSSPAVKAWLIDLNLTPKTKEAHSQKRKKTVGRFAHLK